MVEEQVMLKIASKEILEALDDTVVEDRNIVNGPPEGVRSHC